LRLTRTESDVSVVFKTELLRSKPITVFYRLLIAALVEGRWSSMTKIRPPVRCPTTQTVLLQLHVLLREGSSSRAFFLFALQSYCYQTQPMLFCYNCLKSDNDVRSLYRSLLFPLYLKLIFVLFAFETPRKLCTLEE